MNNDYNENILNGENTDGDVGESLNSETVNEGAEFVSEPQCGPSECSQNGGKPDEITANNAGEAEVGSGAVAEGDSENDCDTDAYRGAGFEYHNTPDALLIPEIPAASPEDPGVKRGTKIFAIILAVLMLCVLCLAGGFVFGKNFGNSKAPKTAGLASKSDSKEEDIQTVYNNTVSSVVSIKVYNDKNATIASGVIYTSDGYVVTNDHIYSKIASPKFIVRLYDGTEYDAEYIAGDTRSDLAVLKIKATGLKAATFGNSEELQIGETVAAVGYPGVSLNTTPSFTKGIVSSLNSRASTTTSYSTKFIQTDAAINPGSSGGALVNTYSQVVGITSAKLAEDNVEGIGFAIPSTTVKNVVDLLISDGYVKGRAKLGITYTVIDKIKSELKDLPVGLYVASISSDSTLSKHGIKEGDIITHVNDKEITDSSIMLDIIENSKAGDTLALTVYSDETKTSSVYNVQLIEDKGSSSYYAVDTPDSSTADSDDSSDSSGNKSGNSEFNFPAGE